jgi:hypothetical protein
VKTAGCVENVTNLRYLGVTLTSGNCIQEEVKSRLYLGYGSYHSVQNLLSFCFLPKNIRLKM